MNMQRNGRAKHRHQPTKKEKFIMLEQTVKDVINGTHADTETSELRKEIAELKLKLAAALQQGATDALKARRVEALEAERDTLKQQLDTLTPAQHLPVTVSAHVECSIQYDVKAPDLARWQNIGWLVKHYQFVNNDRELPTLAVVMERPAAVPAPLLERSVENDTPKADEAPNSESTPVNEVVPPFTEIIIEEPEAAPVMRGNKLLDKLAQDKPIFAAIAEYGVDAVLDALDTQVYDKARAAYEAATTETPKPWRFESNLLTGGTPGAAIKPDSVDTDTLIIEDTEIIEVLS